MTGNMSLVTNMSAVTERPGSGGPKGRRRTQSLTPGVACGRRRQPGRIWAIATGWTVTRRGLVTITLLGVVAGALVILASRDGVAVGPDSSVYVGVARSVAAGRGLNVPIHYYPLGQTSIGTPPPGHSAPIPTPLVHYAPLGPMLLSIGGHPIGAARVEDALFFGLTVLLVGLIVLSATGALWLAVAAELIVAFSLAPGAVSSVGTETGALLLTVLAFWLLGHHLKRPHPWWLIGCSVAIGLATLERFAAGALILWCVIALRERRRDAFGLFALSSAPLAAWFVYEQVSGRSTGHTVGLHFVPNTFRAAGRAIADWVLPDSSPAPVALLAALAVIVLVALVIKRNASSFPRLLVLFAAVQILALEVAATFFDATVSPEPRELIPVFVAVVIAVACTLDRTKAATIAVVATTGVCVLWGTTQLALSATSTVVNGGPSGYASPRWTGSPILAEVRGLPNGIVIYTNAPDALYLVDGRATSSVPEKRDFSTLRANPRFSAQLAEIRNTLAGRSGFIVYVRGLPRDFLPSEAELQRLLPLRLVREETDGAVYALSS
jgi:hypothetical protein